jgi:hypothetical protein
MSDATVVLTALSHRILTSIQTHDRGSLDQVDAFDAVGVVCGVQRAVVTLSTGEEVTARTSFTDVFVRNGAIWQLRIATSSELP